MHSILLCKWEDTQRQTSSQTAEGDLAPDLTSLNLQKTGRSTSQTQQPVSLNSLFPYRELG